ncbi:hypothetical protein CHUAL_006176 [Chamberlinius hualienensis]
MNVDDYYYDQSTRGHNTKDCTIFLDNILREAHEGNWTCSNMDNHKFNTSIKSKDSVIRVEALQIVKEPKAIIFVYGRYPVSLECVFNANVDCSWMINGYQMKVDDYYWDQSARGRNTKDCSIILENGFEKFDEGTWTCSNVVNDKSTNKSISTKIELKVEKTFHSPSASSADWANFIVFIPALTLALTLAISIYYIETIYRFTQPESLIVVADGNNVLLNCEFNANVDCIWIKNGIQTEVDEYFSDQSTRGSNTRLCSIILENATREVHEGNWICSNKVNANINKAIQSQVAEIKIKDAEESNDIRADVDAVSIPSVTLSPKVDATDFTNQKIIFDENSDEDENETVSTASLTGYILVVELAFRSIIIIIVIITIGFAVGSGVSISFQDTKQKKKIIKHSSTVQLQTKRRKSLMKRASD